MEELPSYLYPGLVSFVGDFVSGHVVFDNRSYFFLFRLNFTASRVQMGRK